MGNLKKLHDELSNFVRIREKARETFLETRRRAEDARGSARYTTEIENATEARRATMASAKAAAWRAIQPILEDMRSRANSLKAQPPSEEQLAILQSLQMRETLSADELKAAGNAADGNGMMLAALQEMAKKHDVYYNFSHMARSLTISQAVAAVDSIASEARRILNSTGAARVPLMYAEHKKALDGADFDPDALPQEILEPDFLDFYNRITGLDGSALYSALNGGEAGA